MIDLRTWLYRFGVLLARRFGPRAMVLDQIGMDRDSGDEAQLLFSYCGEPTSARANCVMIANEPVGIGSNDPESSIPASILINLTKFQKALKWL